MTILERLRPHPHRGDIVAAGVAVLTTFAVLVDTRFQDSWAAGVRFVFVGLIAAVIATMAVLSEMEEDEPRNYQSVLYVATFVCGLFALSDLADVVGTGAGAGSSSRTVTWVGAIVAAGCGWFAVRRNAAIMTLLGALSGVVVVLAFVDWVFDPGSATVFRWLLLACALGFALGAVSLRDRRLRHAVSLVDAAGLCVIVLGLTLLVESIFVDVGLSDYGSAAATGGPTGWELVLLFFGFGLVAYSGVDRERVPGFLGVVTLGLFVTIAAGGGDSGSYFGHAIGSGASLLGWPIVLLAMAGILLAIGFRPLDPLPPEPPLGGSSGPGGTTESLPAPAEPSPDPLS